MDYEIISMLSIDGTKEFVNITREDGSMESFPVDETNTRYVQFLAELEMEQA